MSVLVEKNPGREGENDHETRINEGRRTNVRFEIANLNDPMRDQCKRQSAQDADHPGRKIRAENIDRQRMVIGSPRRDEKKNDNHETSGDKF
jgi:hypothetical protein